MKLLNRYIGIFSIFATIFNTCPQGLLVNLNKEIVESSLIVDKNIKEKSEYLTIDVVIPQISGLNNKESEKVINKKILDFTDMWIKDIKEIANEYYGPPNNVIPTFPYELTAKYIIKSQNKILSFYIEYYQFTGGAHGITTRVPYNIDIKTGNELLLKDLFTGGEEYKRIINKEIEKQIAGNPDIYFSGKDGFNGIKEKQQYFMDGNNIVVYFGQYEIAPYTTGIPEFRIPIKLFGNTFKYDDFYYKGNNEIIGKNNKIIDKNGKIF